MKRKSSINGASQSRYNVGFALPTLIRLHFLANVLMSVVDDGLLQPLYSRANTLHILA
jgi:hypothetical protein